MELPAGRGGGELTGRVNTSAMTDDEQRFLLPRSGTPLSAASSERPGGGTGSGEEVAVTPTTSGSGPEVNRPNPTPIRISILPTRSLLVSRLFGESSMRPLGRRRRRRPGASEQKAAAAVAAAREREEEQTEAGGATKRRGGVGGMDIEVER
ncbi:hypothetical protein EYF80_047695 [Liparis tanakae]|uniref:Uncharacterized protein n=1 Tax=Liparis tanakae TaxID=230148 RepID=A0A4Z2FP96_9TELE|nr:hypothetical protein EYF80_047695 [Liparis tanakae]